MVNRLWLFALILGIPILGFAVSEGIQAYFNSEMRSAIQQKYPDMDASRVSLVTLDDLCEDPGFASSEICMTNRNLNLMSSGALLAGIVGIALVLGIWLAGSAAKTNRRLLLYLFKPGLYLTVVILILLIIVHASVAIAAIYYGESILVHRIHIGIIAAIGLGAAIGIFTVITNSFSLVRKAQASVIGKMVSKEQAPALWKEVKAIAEKLGALSPEHIVVGLDPNFFVTEADVVCLDGNIAGRTLYCSLPLCRILSTQELRTIIAHELGHYKGQDTEFSQKFFPIYRGTAMSIVSLHETGQKGARSIALLPAIAILSYFFECFSVAETRISRIRELEADKQGILVANAEEVASALVKVHAFARLWGPIQKAAVNALRGGKAFVNASKTYSEIAKQSSSPEILEGIADSHTSHPTDSHPPLSERLAALEIGINDVSESALDVSPNESAIELLPAVEKTEEEVSGAYQAILARHIGIALDSQAPLKKEDA